MHTVLSLTYLIFIGKINIEVEILPVGKHRKSRAVLGAGKNPRLERDERRADGQQKTYVRGDVSPLLLFH